MHENDYDWTGFRWIALDDAAASIIAFRRIAFDGSEVVVVCNFQPVTREAYKIGVAKYGIYEEVLNSESEEFGGCGVVNPGEIMTNDVVAEHCADPDEMKYSITVRIPPLGTSYFVLKKELEAPVKEVEEEEEADEAEKIIEEVIEETVKEELADEIDEAIAEAAEEEAVSEEEKAESKSKKKDDSVKVAVRKAKK